MKETPDIKKNQGTKDKITGLCIIGYGQYLHNVSRVIQKLFEHGHGKAKQKYTLVQIGFQALSPTTHEKPG
jgi:hypothetical protein